jgi:hypothetical protein
MKPAEEIYKIKFDNYIKDGNTVYSLLILGSEGIIYDETVTPKSIILNGTKVEISFTNDTKMVIKYNDSVELFYRKTEDNGEDIQTEVKQRTVRKRKNPTKSRVVRDDTLKRRNKK